MKNLTLIGTEKQVSFANDLIKKITECKEVTIQTIKDYDYDVEEYRATKSASGLNNKVNKMLRIIEEVEAEINGLTDAGKVITIIKNNPYFSTFKPFRTV